MCQIIKNCLNICHQLPHNLQSGKKAIYIQEKKLAQAREGENSHW